LAQCRIESRGSKRILKFRALDNQQRQVQCLCRRHFGLIAACIAGILGDDAIDFQIPPQGGVESFRERPLHRANVTARHTQIDCSLDELRLGRYPHKPFAFGGTRCIEKCSQVLGTGGQKMRRPRAMACSAACSVELHSMPLSAAKELGRSKRRYGIFRLCDKPINCSEIRLA